MLCHGGLDFRYLCCHDDICGVGSKKKSTDTYKDRFLYDENSNASIFSLITEAVAIALGFTTRSAAGRRHMTGANPVRHGFRINTAFL
jgi:hypothetical protein